MIRLHTLGTLQLLDSAGQPLRSILVQRKRLALLAYLAVASPRGFQRRDEVLLVFWPDLTEDRARNALRQAVHRLRQHLGDGVIVSRGTDEIGIRDGSLWCDAAAFEDELAQGRDAEALDLFRGPLLNGFHFSSASPEFEQWLYDRRRELAVLATKSASRASEAAERAGNLVDAARYAETAFQHSDDDERLLRRSLALLDAAGSGAAALQRYARFADQLAKQLQTSPSHETSALVAQIRAGRRDAGAPLGTLAKVSYDDESSRPDDHGTGHLRVTPAARHPTSALDGPPSVARSAVSDTRALTARAWDRRWRGAALALASIVVVALAALGLLSRTWHRASPSGTASGRSLSSGRSAERAIALRLYDQGLLALKARDGSAAERLFSAAVEEDSTFALAAYSAARADLRADHGDFPSADKFFRLAARQSAHSSDRDRLEIQQGWADFQNDPARLALAETLAVRYPLDAAGHAALGEARLWSGAFLSAIPPLRRAVTLDSASVANGGSECIACSALFLQITAFRYADSLTAAERIARGWTIAAPLSPIAWRELADILAAEGRYDQARAAYRGSAERSHEGEGVSDDLLQLDIISGELARADAQADDEIAGGNDQERQRARWFKIIGLRNQGRLRDALDVAMAYRLHTHQQSGWTNHDMYDALPEAQVLYEMGRALQSAALFDSISRDAHRSLLPRLDARNRAWIGTLSAEARSAAGDTAALARLLVTVRQAGSRSAFGRDQFLANHVAGLLELHRGNLAAAAAAFRRAMFSPTMGYTRTNYDLAQALLSLGRAREAIAVVQPALHGVVDASNLYVTRTDLHEVLARAFQMNAQPDSAAAHYLAVATALSHADPEIAPRRADAVAQLGELSRHKPR
ncbi:MAG: hypothetical protein M3R65_08935 [Gemmatimonadota bacterium]|nr:hypothetical protein [Gemmatimonadota bacterium]